MRDEPASSDTGVVIGGLHQGDTVQPGRETSIAHDPARRGRSNSRHQELPSQAARPATLRSGYRPPPGIISTAYCRSPGRSVQKQQPRSIARPRTIGATRQFTVSRPMVGALPWPDPRR